MEYFVWCVGGLGRLTPVRHAADRGDQLVHLVPHQKPAVAGLGPLAVLDLDRAGVLLHLRQGVDDLVPAEVAAGDLEDDVLQEPRPEEPGRAAALAGAEADRHPHLLVQVGHPHLEPLPHRRGEGPEGHAAQDERVDLPDRRDPSPFPVDPEGLLGRQDPAQEGPQLEFVAARVQGGVGQHGDADELDLVQDALAARSAVPRAAAGCPPG